MKKIYISYIKEDYYFLHELQKQINANVKGGLISVYTSELMHPGANKVLYVNDEMQKADIIIMLVSPDFLNSSFIMDVEVKIAIEQQENGESFIMPIIIEKCDWQSSIFSNFQVYDFSIIENHGINIQIFVQEIDKLASSKNDFKGLLYAKKRISENLKKTESSINLSNCGLKDLSELPELWKCQHLEGLNLGLIETLGSKEGVVLSKFPYFGENQIREDGAKSISKYFPKLKHLYLSGNQIGDEGAKAIAKNLLELISLDLSLNSLEDVSIKVIAENLKYLTYLNLRSNKISDMGAKYLSTKLEQLEVLSLKDNQISDIGAIVISENLEKLSLLDLGINKIRNKGALAIGNLKRLTILDLQENEISVEGVFGISAYLKNLSSLIMTRNIVNDDGIEIIVRNLKKLEKVDFSANDTIKINPEILKSINGLREHFGVSLDENIDIKIKLIPNNTTKMILVGNSTTGKTTLAKYLLTEKFTTKHDSTHGVQCWVWEPMINGQKYKVNIKDFGGQDYFHATHSMFLDAESLFILLHNNETVHNSDCKEDDQYHNLDYWLGNISDVLKDTHKIQKEGQKNYAIWYVQNKTDHKDYQKEWLGKSKYSDQTAIEHQYFISIKAAYENKTNLPIVWRHFLESLKEKIVELSTTEITEWWAAIRDEALLIWRDEKLYLTRDEFSNKCKEFLASRNIPYVTENEAFAGILTYLKNSGEVIWFVDKPELSDYIFTGADSLTQYLFKNILDKKAKKNGGVIRLAKTHDDMDIYIQVLLDYGLIFEKKSGVYIAPQFLPEEPHISKFTHLMPLGFALRFTDYLPRYVITGFITKFAIEGFEAHYWRYGVMFKMNGVLCIIQSDVNSQVMSVNIEDKKEKYVVLKNIFDYFSRDVKAFPESEKKVNVVIGRKTNLELSINHKDYFSIEIMVRDLDHCHGYLQNSSGSYQQVPAIFYFLLNKQNKAPKTIFLCYSHADVVHREELDKHLAALKLQGKVDTFHDGKILPGQKWDEVIKSKLYKSDIVLLLLSVDFMNSIYIWETELKIAKDEGKTIIPVFLRHCDFAGTGIEQDQGVPFAIDNGIKGIAWILSDKFNSKDEAFLKVVERVKTAL